MSSSATPIVQSLQDFAEFFFVIVVIKNACFCSGFSQKLQCNLQSYCKFALSSLCYFP